MHNCLQLVEANFGYMMEKLQKHMQTQKMHQIYWTIDSRQELNFWSNFINLVILKKFLLQETVQIQQK